MTKTKEQEELLERLYDSGMVTFEVPYCSAHWTKADWMKHGKINGVIFRDVAPPISDAVTEAQFNIRRQQGVLTVRDMTPLGKLDIVD